MSVNSTDPGTLFGGEWEQIQGKFLLGADSTYEAGTTGGAASVTSGEPSNNTSGSTALTIAQMPSHGHRLSYRTSVVASGTSGLYFFDVGTAGTWHSSGPSLENTGSGKGHTHTLSSHTHTVATMPPYLSVYIWKRVA